MLPYLPLRHRCTRTQPGVTVDRFCASLCSASGFGRQTARKWPKMAIFEQASKTDKIDPLTIHRFSQNCVFAKIDPRAALAFFVNTHRREPSKTTINGRFGGLKPPKTSQNGPFWRVVRFRGFLPQTQHSSNPETPESRLAAPCALSSHVFRKFARYAHENFAKNAYFTSTQSCARAANLNETCLTYLLLIHTYPYSSTSAYPASVVTRPALSLRLRPSTKTNACSVRARMWVRCCAAAACTECRRTEQILSEAAPGALRPGTTAFAYGSPVRRHPAIVAGLVARRVAQRGLLLRKRPGTKLLVTALRPEQSLYARSVHNRETPQHLHMPFRQGYL